MVNQYPDTIEVTIKTAPVQDPTTGDWTLGSSTDYTFKCRAEVNVGNGIIVGRDGAVIYYSYMVYMPRTSVVIPFDADFVLTRSDSTTYTGKVKGASNGQLNSRIWL
jgi:hypothetical protein